MRARKGAHLTFVDFLPAVYVAYVVVSMTVLSNGPQGDSLATPKNLFLTVALGPLVYYFLTIGPGADVSREQVILVLLAGAAVQGVFALVEFVTHWNLWGFYEWQRTTGARSVSTLGNPGILGTFLGIGIVLALTVLTWGGTRSLRRLSLLVLVVGIPGILATLTRGPILATAIAAVGVLVLGRRRLLATAVIASTVLALVAFWPNIQTTKVYQERAAVSETIRARQGIQDWSLQLAAQKPVFGWGYGSFDRAKNTSGLTGFNGVPIAFLLQNTSHNTYLTILVELGAVGLLLYALPFLVITARAIARARAPTPDTWIIVGSVASLLVIVLSASALDFRFFSMATMLPWLFLAILRRETTAYPADARVPT
jgi:exopolysaccharide production protein ExoQ